jgi:hypothetical protein
MKRNHLKKKWALDPELLGKIMKSLMLSVQIILMNILKHYNRVRRVKKIVQQRVGVYYTPREIVHYMGQESLINYLDTELQGKIEKEDIEEFVKYADFILAHEKTALEKSEQIEKGEIRKQSMNTGFQIAL